jgi:hypothetical protein
MFLLIRHRQWLVWTAVLVSIFSVTSFFVAARYSAISKGAASWGVGTERTWIDDAVGPDADVAVMWPGRFAGGLEGRYAIWENEIFNRSVGRVYDLREPLKRYVPETRVRVDPRSGVVRDLTGHVIAARYVLSDVSFSVVGTPVARDTRTGVVLYAVDGIVRAARVPDRT